MELLQRRFAGAVRAIAITRAMRRMYRLGEFGAKIRRGAEVAGHEEVEEGPELERVILRDIAEINRRDESLR